MTWEISLQLFCLENAIFHRVLAAYIVEALFETEKHFHFKFLICRHSEDIICSYPPSMSVFNSQSFLTLCDPMDDSLPDSSVHGISQARVLEWIAISFSKGSSGPRNRIASLVSPAMAGKFFTTVPLGKPSTFHTSLYSVHSAKVICLSP